MVDQSLINALKAKIFETFKDMEKKHSSTSILLVEGKTDKDFLRPVILGNVYALYPLFNEINACKHYDLAKKNMNSVYAKIRNNKDEILSTLRSIPYDRCLKDKVNNIFGMVDKDFDESDDPKFADLINKQKLFLTDTHDLETFLLKTDDDVLDDIEVITQEDFEDAAFVAYQIGLIKSVDRTLKTPCVDYSEYTKENKIILEEFLRDAKHKIPKQDLIQHKIIKRNFSNDGNSNNVFNKDMPSDGIESFEDFWNIVNGHDILYLLRLHHDELWQKYGNPFEEKAGLNRELESALIKKYSYPEFLKEKSNLWKNLIRFNLIEPNKRVCLKRKRDWRRWI